MFNRNPKLYTKKRQLGAERRIEPLPILHDIPSTRKIAFSRLAIVLTVCFWFVFAIYTIARQLFEAPQSFQFTMEAFGYLVVVTFLTLSALMYLIARQGAYERFSKHSRASRAEIDQHFAHHHSDITVLVPSYSEEPQVIRKTLLSAALQEYPSLRLVLLLDDNPNPTNPQVLKKLNTTRDMGQSIMQLLSEPKFRFTRALKEFEKKQSPTEPVSTETIELLAGHYHWAANWLSAMADNEVIEDHVDVFFADQVLRALAKDLQLVGRALDKSVKEQAALPYNRVQQLFSRLAWTFTADIKVFERKKFASLSHEANKAMNLNSYIGLMGGTYSVHDSAQGIVLLPTDKPTAETITIPDSEFLLTLDADSILLREYCLRLVHFLQQPDNANVAVTQTPYSSFRGAATRIERLAAATTDIQHILHQGMTQFSATFWVGANAVIRKKALEDIAEAETVNGFQVHRYIQDRTVIEDTESSIDLAIHGWTLVNYPERLSYSATPPDFGALVVQRRRWANGGLLILPKFLNQVRKRKNNKELVSNAEVMLRVNYMASIAWASFGLIFLLAYPYNGRLLSPFVLLSAIPYFWAMASDLKYCGYNRLDILRIYGFNLILLPVNLAGVLKSIQQALTAKKIPFARTPKVKNRTAVSILFAVSPILIVAFSGLIFWQNVLDQNWGNAAFAAFNAITATYAIVAYIGIWNTIVDIWLGLTDWMYVQKKPKTSHITAEPKAQLDWQAVLYHGQAEGAMPTITPAITSHHATERQALS